MPVSPFLVAPAALLAGTLALEAALARRDARRHPRPGRLVEVGGHRLHARLLNDGDAKGSGPVVVLEAGAGEWSSHWGRLPELLSQSASVLVYDRAGLGWSEAGPAPRDAETAAVELRELLRRLAPRRRVLMVAHGWGAHVARVFAGRYPFEMHGLVLVDGEHEALESALAAAGVPSLQTSTRAMAALAALGRVGFLRLSGYSPLPDPEALDLGRSQHETIRALSRSSRVLAAMSGELAAAPASSAQVARAAGALEIPVRALVAAESLAAEGLPPGFPRDRFNEVWRSLGERFAELSPDARADVVPGADHVLQLRSPQIVATAVRGLLTSVPRA